MNRMILAATAALMALAAATSVAADYVVVRSSAPAVAKGAQLAAGQRVDVGPGQVLTVVSAGGEVSVLRGAAGGVTLPALAAASQAASSAALVALVSRPAPRRSFGAMRGKDDCPAVESLTSVESILAAAKSESCASIAQQALDRLAAAAESSAAPAKN